MPFARLKVAPPSAVIVGAEKFAAPTSSFVMSPSTTLLIEKSPDREKELPTCNVKLPPKLLTLLPVVSKAGSGVPGMSWSVTGRPVVLIATIALPLRETSPCGRMVMEGAEACNA